jgi:phosphopantothenoylcysteine synthetase/decarboxylase
MEYKMTYIPNIFFIKANEIVEGFKFENPMSDVAEAAGLPYAEEYAINWRINNDEIHINGIDANGSEVWKDSEDKEWTDDDDNLFEALSHYITNNVL